MYLLRRRRSRRRAMMPTTVSRTAVAARVAIARMSLGDPVTGRTAVLGPALGALGPTPVAGKVSEIGVGGMIAVAGATWLTGVEVATLIGVEVATIPTTAVVAVAVDV